MNLKNTNERNNVLQLEANLEAITKAINQNIEDTRGIVSSIEKENEELRNEIELKRSLIDKIQELKDQGDSYFSNCFDEDDFLQRCAQLQERLEQLQNSFGRQKKPETPGITDLRRKLSTLKQKNIAEQTKLGIQIMQLTKEKEYLAKQLQKYPTSL